MLAVRISFAASSCTRASASCGWHFQDPTQRLDQGLWRPGRRPAALLLRHPCDGDRVRLGLSSADEADEPLQRGNLLLLARIRQAVTPPTLRPPLDEAEAADHQLQHLRRVHHCTAFPLTTTSAGRMRPLREALAPRADRVRGHAGLRGEALLLGHFDRDHERLQFRPRLVDAPLQRPPLPLEITLAPVEQVLDRLAAPTLAAQAVLEVTD